MVRFRKWATSGWARAGKEEGGAGRGKESFHGPIVSSASLAMTRLRGNALALSVHTCVTSCVPRC